MTAREEAADGDVQVLDALDMPRTCSEITKLLRRKRVEEWAEAEAEEFDWDDEQGMPVQPAVRLLAHVYARERGKAILNNDGVYRRLVKFERLGIVERVQVGHRRTLWVRKPVVT